MSKAEKRLGKAVNFGQLTFLNNFLNFLNTGEFEGIDIEKLGFEGTITPEAGPLIESGLAQIGGLAGSPEAAERSGATSRILSGETGIADVDPALRERFFRQAITDPALLTFNQQIAPQVAHRFLARGQQGAAMRELARAGSELTGNLAGLRAGLLREDERILGQSRENALNRLLPGAQLSLNQQLQTAGATLGAGDIERQIRGQFNQERLQRLLAKQPFNDPRFSLAPLAFGLAPGGGGGGGGGGSGFGGLLSAIGSVGGALGSVGGGLKDLLF